jgi:hypothetical protein
VITLTSQPVVSLSGPATMTWTVDDPTATVTCSFDGGAPTVCAGTYTVNGAGLLVSHTVIITATDPAGNVSSPLMAVTWTQVL